MFLRFSKFIAASSSLMAAIPFIVLAQVQDVRIVNTPNVVIDGQPLEVWSDSTFNVDIGNSPTVYIGGLSDNNQLGYIPVGVDGDVQIVQKPNTLLKVDVDMGDFGVTFGDWAEELNGYASKLEGISLKLTSVLSNVASQAHVINNIQDYSQTISYNSTNLPLIKTTLDDALYHYDEGIGENESVAEILADIRDNGLSGGFDLGIAFTNLASAISFMARNSSTNFSEFADSLVSNDGSFFREYSLLPLYFNFIMGDIPYYSDIKGKTHLGYNVPSSAEFLKLRNTSLFSNLLLGLQNGAQISNLISATSKFKYDAYNTYETLYNLTNFWAQASFATITNTQAELRNPLYVNWYDSYATKPINMLLQFGSYAAITNSKTADNVPDYARNWYDSYSPRIILDYLIASDFLTGTNSFSDLCDETDSKVDSYSLSKLPKWGMSTNSESLNMGTIEPNVNSDYLSKGNAISGMSLNSEIWDEYGDVAFGRMRQSLERAIDKIESQVVDSSGGDDGSATRSMRNTEHQGLSLRVAGLESEYVNIPEQYIDFTIGSAAKDKLSGYWSMIKTALHWGLLTWSFFACWGMIANVEFKQQSPTILD